MVRPGRWADYAPNRRCGRERTSMDHAQPVETPFHLPPLELSFSILRNIIPLACENSPSHGWRQEAAAIAPADQPTEETMARRSLRFEVMKKLRHIAAEA